MTLEGAKVEMVCELMPYSGGLTRNIVQCLDDMGIPLKLSCTVIKTHGIERLEGVTIANVDEKRRPIPGTEQYVECDTLMLSVGLIPENELTRNAGVIIDPVTNGAVVDENRQTNIPGIFACGNVLQVHDLVDYVTEESQIAGKGAADYIFGKKKGGTFVNTKGINGVRYVVPQRVNIEGEDKLKLYFRVGQVFMGAKVVVECDGEILSSRKKPKLAPGEMENVVITPEMLKKMNENSEIIVRVEE
jgi:NAD(P)H-nitrite reductase large subunit